MTTTTNQTKPQDIQAIMAELERLKAENQTLKTQKDNARYAVRLKVSEKGAVSVYGLGRYPVTLYKRQMQKLMSMKVDIEQFIKDNDGVLVEKAEQ